MTPTIETLAIIGLGLVGIFALGRGLIMRARDQRAEVAPIAQDDFTPAMRRWQGMLSRWGVWQ